MIDTKNNNMYNVCTNKNTFQWDPAKNEQNIAKHGVSFEEAQTVFDDVNGILISDINHSDEEERFIVIGSSANDRILYVCHCYRGLADTIRIISARKAEKVERELYEKQFFKS